MRIAIIQPRVSYFVGGSEKISLIHTDLLSSCGHDVKLFTVEHPKKEMSFLFESFFSEHRGNISFSKIPLKFVYLYDIVPGMNDNRWKTESLLFNSLIFDKVKKYKPDIILSYYLPDSFSKPLNAKNVVFLGGYPKKKIDLYESFLEFCDGVISISNIVKQKWESQLKPIKNHNYVCGTGVFYPPKILKKMTSPFKYNIVFAGRLIDRKGVLLLLKAYSLLIKNNSDMHLWLLGEGPLRKELIKEIRKNNLEKFVTLTGVINNPLDYFKMSDVCVFPSYEKDGLMGVVLEAMSVGATVVTTLGSGSEDVIKNNINGLLIKPKDEKSIYEAIIFLFKNKKNSKKIGIKAKNYIKNNMTWKKKIKEFEKILLEISLS